MQTSISDVNSTGFINITSLLSSLTLKNLLQLLYFLGRQVSKLNLKLHASYSILAFFNDDTPIPLIIITLHYSNIRYISTQVF